MTRTATLRDYEKRSTLLSDFGTLATWQNSTRGTVEADTTNVREGNQSVKVTTAAGDWAFAQAAISEDMSASGRDIRLDYFLPEGTKAQLNFLRLYWSSSTTLASHYVIYLPFEDGWNSVRVIRSGYANTGSESWDNTMIRVRVRTDAKGAATPSVTFDSLKVGVDAIPNVLLTFDDVWSSVYSFAYPLMKQYGLRGTLYAAKDLIGTAGYMTAAQLAEMASDGWDVANHTVSHSALDGLTLAQQRDELTNCRLWLESLGFRRASRHVAYPFGNRNADTDTAMDAEGMTTGALGTGAVVYPPFYRHKQYPRYNIGSSQSLDVAKGYVDSAMEKRLTTFLMFHKFAATSADSITWAEASMEALVAHIASRKPRTPTISEWYRGLGGERTRAVGRTAVT